VVVLLLWLLGAYNRLKRLRQAVDAAWGQIEEVLQRRAAALEPLIEALRVPLADEAAALQAVGQALEAQRLAAFAVRARPLDGARLAAWAAAEAALASPWSRLRALIELQAELPRHEAVAPRLASVIDGEPRLAQARLAYNEAAQAFDHALQELPTRWLSGVLRFRPAGRV
jgi:LemA protein